MKKLLTILLLITSQLVMRAEDLAIKLEAFHVIPATATEPERVIAADTAGTAVAEIVEYRAIYTNTTAGTLRNLVPEIPIPAGLVAVADTDLPKAASASLDGKTFVSLPLVGADGKAVPHAAFKAFRWSAADLAAGQSVTVRIRATLAR